jgi:pyruvate ferredoxin oxidoreductase gamma subunit
LGLETYLSGHRLDRVLALPATAIAMKHLGKPVPNAVLLGGLAALTSVVSLEAVCQAVRELFPGAIGEANVAAATEAFTFVTEHFLPTAAATGELS